MSQRNDKKFRRVVNKKAARDNQAVFQAFMLEISAQPFWQRFWFCARMAFKRHNLQKSLKNQIVARKRLLKAQKIAAGQDEKRALKFTIGFLIGTSILAGIGFIIFGVGG